jgi:hypothetical protein
MKKIVALLIAILFIASCAGVQEVKKGVVTGPNYSGLWTGQYSIEAIGTIAKLDLTLIHKDATITGTITDSENYVSNTPLTNVVLKEKTLTFSCTASTPMGNLQVDYAGTFSEDDKELTLTFVVPSMNVGGNAKLIKS